MKLTIKDCMSLSAFDGGVLVAGQRNAENRVKSVSVMDSTNIDDVIRNNGVLQQMVLTSFRTMRDDKHLMCESIRELAKCGACAVVVFDCDDSFIKLNGELIDIAEQVGMPLIFMDKESSYSDVIEQVVDRLLYGNNFRNNLINNTIFHLLNFEKHKTFENALREAAVSNDFQVILLSRDFNPILSIETRQRATIADAIRLGKERNVEKGGVYTFIDVDGVLTYWGPIMINQEKYFIFIVDNDDNYSAGEITKLAEIIELAMGMWRYSPQRDVKVELIKALIRGNKSLAYSLKDEVGIKSEDIVSVFYAKGIDNNSYNSIIADYEKKIGMEIVRISEDDETYGLVLKKKNKKLEEEMPRKALCLRLYEQLKGDVHMARLFHATGIDGLEGAGDGFKLISETWPFVESVFPYKRVFTKYELAMVSNCINLQVQGGYLKKNYMDLLDPFRKEMGEHKAKQLLETLETFVLDAGMNSSRTAEFMGIHTNTVQYRLKKINEVLGAEITGNRVIPGLTIALALKRLDRVVK